MASSNDIAIVNLPAATSVTSDDLFVIVNDPLGNPETQKITARLVTSTFGQVYIDRAPTAPADTTVPALSYPTGGGTLQQWDVASQTWV